jgi:hypothetical protein
MPAHVAAQTAARLALGGSSRWTVRGTFPAGLSIRRVVVDDGQMVSEGSESQAPPIVVYQSRITYHSSTFRRIEPEQRNINPRKYSSTSSFSTRLAKPRHGS